MRSTRSTPGESVSPEQLGERVVVLERLDDLVLAHPTDRLGPALDPGEAARTISFSAAEVGADARPPLRRSMSAGSCRAARIVFRV